MKIDRLNEEAAVLLSSLIQSTHMTETDGVDALLHAHVSDALLRDLLEWAGRASTPERVPRQRNKIAGAAR